jgi:crotonobetainyl-CoA:carnitine CoA-transferase CaiB-like acyl-CoA transferase
MNKQTNLPLSGIKILNAARLLPGGYCTTILSSLGADVIKLEHPVGGDPGRVRPELLSIITQGNKSVTVNLSSEKGRAICYQIARQSDIFLESFRPGVAKRLGIDYKTLKPINPKIIYASISGFGQEGPYRDLPAHDLSYQGIAGMLAGIVSEEAESFQTPSVPIADLSSGMFTTISILAALYHLKETGKGQYIDVSITDGLVSWMSTRLFPNSSLATQKHPATGIYRTKDGKYLTLSIAFEQHFWRNLCGAINRKDLSELTVADWTKKSEELSGILKDAFLSKTRDEWMQILISADVPHGPVYMSPNDVFNDPQLQFRGMLEEVNDDDGKKTTRIGSSLKSAGMPVKIDVKSPALGEHTEEILLGLGYDKKEIKEMKKAGVI